MFLSHRSFSLSRRKCCVFIQLWVYNTVTFLFLNHSGDQETLHREPYYLCLRSGSVMTRLKFLPWPAKALPIHPALGAPAKLTFPRSLRRTLPGTTVSWQALPFPSSSQCPCPWPWFQCSFPSNAFVHHHPPPSSRQDELPHQYFSQHCSLLCSVCLLYHFTFIRVICSLCFSLPTLETLWRSRVFLALVAVSPVPRVGLMNASMNWFVFR